MDASAVEGNLLAGKKGLVIGVTNKNSIGWHIADLAQRNGAEVMVAAQNDRLLEGAKKLIDGREGFSTATVDFSFEEQYAALREQVEGGLGKLDFLVHSVG
ncbi:SDR family oxidoreductase, partial [bacterium]